MRMQLKRLTLGFFLLFSMRNAGFAQSGSGNKKYNIGDVEVDFISSYYQQDGEHGAVLGGIGSQALNDAVFAIELKVPVDSQYIFNGKFSFDSYTSASSAAIDPGIPVPNALRGDPYPLTGASYNDQRSYGNLGFTNMFRSNQSYNVGLGFSSEFDVSSFSLNGGYSIETADKNTGLQFNLVGLHDNWKLIYPVELRYLQGRPDTLLNKHIRNTFSGSVVLSHVFTPRFQAALIYEYTAQKGLLSTPFHRVVFNDGLSVDNFFKTVSIEKLPDFRNKHAFGLRTSAYPFNSLIVRNFFRYYFDSFGIESYTAEIELPVKFTRFFSVYPFYRYYQQTASDYFAPFNTHVLGERYYTSDYDLSEFSSQKIGAGMRLSPPFGIARSNGYYMPERRATFKSINFRGGIYRRSDGLHSFFGSIDLTITL
ncbi:DUF3570 domain-containing protein [Saccharicrinis sp. FJH54]|uniref:DUF3570 domain-containing protein n=1 Tax=Saccharicrinis sp. FJH54 TaxID=3344665 RepID=UPI0035D4F6A6